MAKKVNKGPKTRQRVDNFCNVCGEKAIAIRYVPTKGKGSMFWRCDNGHMERTRKYNVVYIK